jgi:hypothetical protein
MLQFCREHREWHQQVESYLQSAAKKNEVGAGLPKKKALNGGTVRSIHINN